MIIKSSYWGEISTWSAIARSGEVAIEACENFQKQSSRSRTAIMTAGGVRTLSVPIIHNNGAKIAIRDVCIDYTLAWQREQLRTIVAAYASAPFYDHFFDAIAPIFALNEKFLFDLNLRTFEVVAKILKIGIKPTFTTEFSPQITAIAPSTEQYYQVFSDRHPFAANLSILDSIFCLASLPSAE